ncbi:uncharacterized protein PAN0_031d6239 [Moesziomyces antarcticus]|uniref:Uncharacterized protein n=1 Tax=Pseudozyma antarctica TaxID=84753 RepID=A0A081CMW3_PSEA2|nr:uncharacterized protein PAN0_031d6239 [Moesziomyces antarcticus]GAK68009.1 hypothetical protein PAN0_031d6239 [Moesziomyces antarcticus]
MSEPSSCDLRGDVRGLRSTRCGRFLFSHQTVSAREHFSLERGLPRNPARVLREHSWYAELVEDIVCELERSHRSAHDRIKAHGSHDAGVQVYFASFSSLFARYRQQKRLATQPNVAAARDSRRRQSTRAQKKRKRRSKYLTGDEELRRRFHGFDFAAIREAMSAEVSEAEEESQTGSQHHAGSDGGGDGHAHAIVVVAPPWRPLELHNAQREIDTRLEQRRASAVAPSPTPTKTGSRRTGRVCWPTSSVAMMPFPGSVQRWMVNGEIASRCPHLVANFSPNNVGTVEAGSVTAIIRTPEQWGQQPPCRIHEPVASSAAPEQAAAVASSSDPRSPGSELHRDHTELDSDDNHGTVHGWDDLLDPGLRD